VQSEAALVHRVLDCNLSEGYAAMPSAKPDAGIGSFTHQRMQRKLCLQRSGRRNVAASGVTARPRVYRWLIAPGRCPSL
jgi:hypothetical protein